MTDYLFALMLTVGIYCMATAVTQQGGPRMVWLVIGAVLAGGFATVALHA